MVDTPDIEAADPQDVAEVFDETNLTENGEEFTNFDVLDLTSRTGDVDEDEFDEDEVDDDDLEEDDELDYRTTPGDERR